MFSVMFFVKLQVFFLFSVSPQKIIGVVSWFHDHHVFMFQGKLPDSSETQLDRTHTETSRGPTFDLI